MVHVNKIVSVETPSTVTANNLNTIALNMALELYLLYMLLTNIEKWKNN
jgi:hypothetical protein